MISGESHFYLKQMPLKTCDAFINKSARVSTVWACSVMPSHVCQAMFIRNIKSGWLNLAYRQGEHNSMSSAYLSMTVNRLRPFSKQKRTNVDSQLPASQPARRTTGRLGANMQSRGSNREMEGEERHKHRGGFTYHTRAERRELSAALHEQETEEKQNPRHPQ